MRLDSSARGAAALLLIACLTGQASGQSYQINTTQIPQGNPFNNSSSENVDFGDVDLDGDFDAAFADGGDCCNDQNRLWVNQGGAQGGTLGFFVDETATRFPAVTDDGRDIEFADFEGDGDLDVFSSNTAQIVNQPNRFWVNQGGVQAGAVGFYVDDTQARYVGLGGPGSSINPALVLASGGYIDWSCDSDFADIDVDGDLDLFQSSYGGAFGGQVPSRFFLNDGNGFFSEFNPSGFQLTGVTIADGNPALWGEGLQQDHTGDATGAFSDVATALLDLDFGDVSGDRDIDLLFGDRHGDPRLFHNRLEETRTLIFRDVTAAAFQPGSIVGNGMYEQEMGDLDGDADLDIYGLNWFGPMFLFSDAVYLNNGDGTFGPEMVVPNSGSDDNEVDFLDYDNDGDLDVYIANFSGQDRLYENDGSAGLTDVTAQELPVVTVVSLDADACDVDLDGDYDLFIAADNNAANIFLECVNETDDLTAPTLAHLEQAPDRFVSPVPTPVRVHVYDNAPYYTTWYNPTELEYRVDGGSFTVVPMLASGGQVFGASIPGTLAGTVEYRVTSRDQYGNTATSPLLSYVGSSGCDGNVMTYCTAKVATGGCVPSISSIGVPSATPGNTFVIQTSDVPLGNLGIFFYGQNGQAAIPFQGGFICPQPPTLRTPSTSSGPGVGTCDGVYSIDFNNFIASGVDPALVSGAPVQIQTWFRDPPDPVSGTGLSDALDFVICP